MKKKVFLFVILIVMLVLALCGCKKLVPGDSTILYDPKADGMEIVKNLDSYDVMQEAFTYYKNCNKYRLDIDFIFNATAPLTEMYQNSVQTTIRNGADFYDYYAVAGKGHKDVPTGNGHIFFYNQNTKVAQVKYVRENNSRIKLNDKKVVANFDGISLGDFDATIEEEGIKTPLDRVNKNKSKLHQYLMAEKNISKQTDELVYKKGDKYYCTIMINTTDMSVDKGNYQGAVVKAIEKATGGKYDQFNEDTRMVAELERIDDTFRFTQFILMEDYQGKKKEIGLEVTLKVSQYYWHKFAYDTKSITIPERK